jgi:hypothetical protein
MSGYVGLSPPKSQRRGAVESEGRAQGLETENAGLVVGPAVLIVENNGILKTNPLGVGATVNQN